MQRVKGYVEKFIAIVLLHAGLTIVMVCALYNHYGLKDRVKETSTKEVKHVEFEDGGQSDELPLINDMEHDILIPSLSFYFNKLNIIVEEFKIMTPDGFPLALWHLKDTNPHSHSKHNKPMLFIHGLLQSSASFASSGDQSLAYYFNNQGYDIWLGNNRIGFNMDPIRNKNDKNYWNWDMNEMYKIDLPTLINFVQEKTHFQKVNLVGHSQGTTEIFLSLINNIDNINSKIDKFIALSPACYPGTLLTEESRLLRMISKTIDHPWVFGSKSFVKIMMLSRQWFLGTKFFGFICYLFFSFVFEWDNKLWDQKMTARHFMFSPVYVSVKLMQWWLSHDINKISFIQHSSTFLFPEDKKWFNEQQSPEILMIIPRQDKLVDGIRLANHFNKYEDSKKFKYWIIDDYSHLDVLWATNVLEKVGEPLSNYLDQNQ